MKSLATLIKLQKTRVDEQRIVLAKMHDQLEAAQIRVALHKAEMEAQQDLLHDDPSMGLTYGAYLLVAKKKTAELEKNRRAAEYAVHIALEKLAEVFEEQKRYEIAQQNRLARQRKEELHRETLFLDEVGSVGFVRKQKGQ
ncbi:MAG: hypothetical protein PHW63_07500 [Alphaproteobacteria bacterium]|nr:hypothetical protein [Alphaproteobacteria bacterium]